MTRPILLATALGLMPMGGAPDAWASGARAPVAGVAGASSRAISRELHQDPADPSWDLLSLASGSALDLRTGRLAPARPREDEDARDPGGELEAIDPSASLFWVEDGALRATVPVAALGRPASGRGGAGAVPTRWARPDVDDLRVQRKLPAAAGQEVVFLLAGEGSEPEAWGLVRILSADRESAEVEWMLTSADVDELVREPARVLVEGLPDGHRISWGDRSEGDAPAPGLLHRVAARPLGSRGPFEEIGVTAERSLLAPAEPGVAVEYRVERLHADRPRPGTLVVGLRQVVPQDLPVTLEAGLRIDLLSGEVDGPRAHLEITQVHPTSAFVMPMEGVSLQRGGKPGAPMTWTPYLPGPARADARRAQTGLAPGSDIVVRTPEGLFVRLLAERSDDGTIVVRRQVDLARAGVFPVPPRVPLVEEVEEGTTSWTLLFEPLPFGVPEPDLVRLLIEREVRAGVWEEAHASDPGVRELTLALPATGGLPYARLRARHELTSGGRLLPGPAFLQLLLPANDPVARAAASRSAVAGLASDAYGERQAARALLEALGPDALSAVESALRGVDEPGDAPVRGELRELLAGGAFGSRGQGLLLELLGAEAGLDGVPPAAILAEEPDVRALGALRLLGSSELDAWLPVLARAESDALVAALLEALGGARVLPSLAPPVALTGREPFDWRAVVREGSPRDVAARLRAEVDPADRARSWVLLALAHLLEGVGPEGEVEAFEVTELALRLLVQEPSVPPAALLEVVRSLTDASGAPLRASRDLVALRVDAPGPLDRERIELGPDETEVLRVLLTSGMPSDAPLEILLAPGEYDLTDGGTLTLKRPRLRIVGAGLPTGDDEVSGTRLMGSFRAEGVEALELEGVELRSESGVTLWLQDASVMAREVRLLGRQKALQLAGSTLDLVDGELGGTSDSPVPGLLWVGSASAVGAVGCRLVGDTIYLEEGASVLLDRCVVRGGTRSLFQGRARTSRASVVDSLLRVPGGCMQGTGQLVLERSAIEAGTTPLSPQVQLTLCPESVRLAAGDAASLGNAGEHRCALGVHGAGSGEGR